MSQDEYMGKNPTEIVEFNYHFTSDWHIRQALAWIDYAKRTSRHIALSYAALELRSGIELLWFEMIITRVGGVLDYKEYKKCSKESTKMYKILDRLTPDYEKLVCFTRIVTNLDKTVPDIIEWDIKKLKRYHGESSSFLHFMGVPEETYKNDTWFLRSLIV